MVLSSDNNGFGFFLLKEDLFYVRKMHGYKN